MKRWLSIHRIKQQLASLTKGRQKLWLVFILFLVWILFIDSASWINHVKISKKIKEYRQKNFELQRASELNKQEYYKLKDSLNYLQEYARQKFLFKRHDETIFIIDSLE